MSEEKQIVFFIHPRVARDMSTARCSMSHFPFHRDGEYTHTQHTHTHVHTYIHEKHGAKGKGWTTMDPFVNAVQGSMSG